MTVSIGVLPTAAAAHPFGPPPVARLAAEGATLTVTWSAQSDDLTALGFAVGAFAERQVFTFDAHGRPVDAESAPDRDQVLADAPEVGGYLRDHVRVRQGGTACRSTSVDTDAITDSGARLVYACPKPISAVELTIDALTDLHSSYRTVGLVEGADARTLFTAAEPTQTVSFGVDASRSTIPPLLVGVGAAVLALGFGAVVVRARRRGART